MAEAGDASQHARILTALARLHERHGRYDEARTQLLGALDVVRSLDSPYYTAEVLVALAELEARHDDVQHAREHRAEARRLYAGLGDPRAGELADEDR